MPNTHDVPIARDTKKKSNQEPLLFKTINIFLNPDPR